MFLLDATSMRENGDIADSFSRYNEYLQQIRDNIPLETYEFASALWHYDPNDHRCPHDSWVECVTVKEPSSGSRSEIRRVDISARLLGAFHDGWIDLVYEDVKSYSFNLKCSLDSANIGHGDWLIDEVRLSDRKFVLHEVIFSTGGHWVIECSNIRHSWTEQPDRILSGN